MMPCGIHDRAYFQTALKIHPSPALGALCALLFVPMFTWAQPDAPDDLQLEPLRVWVKANWYDGLFDNLGYNEARSQMYGFVDASGGEIECIYTGFQQASGFVTYPNPINAEHLVPQSFYGSASPMKSDIWSIRPCHGSANSARSNDPYGEVPDGSAQWYGVNGSGEYLSTGSQPSNADDFSESTGSIWEPREEFKGDVARSVFYFYTMYPTQAGDTSGVCDPQILYDWHLQDPVSGVEQTRNDRTEIAQGNRNPYVDHPDWVYQAWFWEPPTDIPGCTIVNACNYDEVATVNNGSCVLVGDGCDDGDATTLGDVYTDCGLPDYGCAGTPAPPTTPEGPILYRASFHTTGLQYGFDGVVDGAVAAGETEWSLDPAATTEAMWTEVYQNDTVMAVRNSDDLVTWTSREVNVQGVEDLAVSGDFTGSGGMTGPTDYLEFQVLIDGQPLFLDGQTGDGATTVLPLLLPPASTVQLQVQMRNNAPGEVWRLDEIIVWGTPPVIEECDSDLDGDGIVAVGDVLLLLGQFGCLSNCSADITGDDAVTTADMLAILAEFGMTCL